MFLFANWLLTCLNTFLFARTRTDDSYGDVLSAAPPVWSSAPRAHWPLHYAAAVYADFLHLEYCAFQTLGICDGVAVLEDEWDAWWLWWWWSLVGHLVALVSAYCHSNDL